MTSSNPHHLLRPHLQSSSHWGEGLQHVGFGETQTFSGQSPSAFQRVTPLLTSPPTLTLDPCFPSTSGVLWEKLSLSALALSLSLSLHTSFSRGSVYFHFPPLRFLLLCPPALSPHLIGVFSTFLCLLIKVCCLALKLRRAELEVSRSSKTLWFSEGAAWTSLTGELWNSSVSLDLGWPASAFLTSCLWC